MQGNTVLRTTYLDNLSGVLIVYCVFFYHLPAFVETVDKSFFIILSRVLGFFIAWFFFKSGMLYKKRSVKEEFQKCWRRLLTPYLIINAICLFARILVDLFITHEATVLEVLKVDLYRESDVLCNPLWFCLSLAMVRILYQSLSKVKTNNVFILLSLVFAFLLNFYSYHLGDRRIVNIPPWVGNVFLGYFFYGLGDVLRDFQFGIKCFLVSALLFIVFLFFPNYLDFYKNASNQYLLSVVYDFSGIIVFNNLFKRWLNTQIPLLTHVGANSMIYYVTHYTFFLLVLNNNYEAPSWVKLIVALIQTALFLFVMDIIFTKTRMKWLIGG
jgi:hypothetical protein